MADVETLRQLGIVRKYSTDDYIFCEGDSGNEMYIVLSGKVGVYLNSFNDIPSKVSEVFPGGFFGELSLLDDQPRGSSVVAEQDTVVIAISRSSFQSFIASQPSMAYKIMKSLSARIRLLNDELSRLRERPDKPESSDNLKPSKKSILTEEVKPLKKEKPSEQVGDSQQEPSHSIDQSASQDKLQTVHQDVVRKHSTAQENSIPTVLEGILYPPHHKSYSSVASDTHSAYLIEKQVVCPVCSAKFSTYIPRLSKLKLKHMELDFRKVYDDFEPLWYSIWVCPNCNYSDYYFEFDKVSGKQAKLLSEKLEEIKGRISVDLSNPRMIDQVFNAYYIALYCAKNCNASPLKLARLQMQLSWLYKDVGDEEMYKTTAMSALDLYHDALYNHNLNIPVEQEQQCFMILGELFLLKGDKNEAMKHYHSAIKRGNGSPALNAQARDRIQDIRKL